MPSEVTIEITIRDARDDDAEGLIALIGAVFAEYAGCVLDVDGELPELRALASSYGRVGGRAWVAVSGGVVVGSVACTPSTAPGGLELRKLYVAKEHRGSGVADRLLALVEDEARACGARFIDMWSDTRFERAHRFYEKRGWVRGAETRALHDKSGSVEYYFRREFG